MDNQPLEEILMDLKIVSMLQPNQKLYINNNRLALDTSPMSSWTTKIWRYFGNQTRRNVLHKIRQRIGELENYINNKLIQENWIEDEFKSLKPNILQGLQNMQSTYESDSQTVVCIDILSKRIENLI